MTGCKNYFGPEAAPHLLTYGLEEKDMIRVVEYGEMTAAATTRHDTPIYKALTPYNGRTRAFRDIHVPRGWTSEKQNGQALTFSPDRRFCFITLGGDETTGLILQGVAPQPSSGLRAQFLKFTRMNASFLMLPFIEPQFARPSTGAEPTNTITLCLYVYRDRVKRELRAEVAIPLGTAGPDSLCYYAERIILASIPMGGPGGGGVRSRTPIKPVTPEVDIRRRRA